ncbi:MAG: hypothetical protein KatS3mg051_1573 [Anaerolineae bacterium]|nr:MAG: hypothetical protein KatS3mg051_1573 [Anaerolineae bacterium]
MVTGEYATAWDALVARLQAATSELGVPPERIVRGEFGKQPSLEAPYVLVYLEPEAAVTTSAGGVLDVTYRLRVFVVVSREEQAQAITEAWDLGVRVYDALTAGSAPRLIVPEGEPPILIDYVAGSVAVVVVQLDVFPDA